MRFFGDAGGAVLRLAVVVELDPAMQDGGDGDRDHENAAIEDG